MTSLRFAVEGSVRVSGRIARALAVGSAATFALVAPRASAQAQQPYPPQQPYPQQQPYPAQQPYPQQQPQQAAPRGDRRSMNEMYFLYGAGALYGVGTGVWLDSLFKVTDPGLAIIAPIAFGAAVPVGVYLWDNYSEFHRGVPSSIALGLTLGALEGVAISGTQAQHSGAGNTWAFSTQSTLTFLGATGGAIGGYAFGEWFRPDPRSVAFIGSGAGWGAITGTLFGAGLTARSGDWKDGASVAGLIGYNAGIFASGALSTIYTPSWNTQKWMWAGYGLGVAATSVVYIFYGAAGQNASNGLIANAVGGLGGLTLAAILTARNTDPEDRQGAFTPPFNIGFAPMGKNGGMMTAYGQF